MTQYIYILKLKNDKFYVGRSKKVWERIVRHYQGLASAFTRKFRPIQIIDIFESSSPFDEDNKTKEMMVIHGIKNVRGGSYNRIKLTEVQEYFLKKEIYTLQKRCYNCGQEWHFIGQCPEKKTVEPKKPSATQIEQIDLTEDDGREALLGHRRELPIVISDGQDELPQDSLQKKRKDDTST